MIDIQGVPGVDDDTPAGSRGGQIHVRYIVAYITEALLLKYERNNFYFTLVNDVTELVRFSLGTIFQENIIHYF